MANSNPVNNNRPDRGKNRKAGNSPKLTAEQESILLAKSLRLRPKSKAVLDELVNDPKLTQTDAYLKHHNVSRQVAGVKASQLVNKDSARVYTSSVEGRAKRRMASLIDSKNESIALKASDSVLDRNLGKSIQRSENTSKVIEVKLDLTGARIGAHYVAPDVVPTLDQ